MNVTLKRQVGGDTVPRIPRRKRVVLADRRGTRAMSRTIMDLEEQTSMGEALVANLVRLQLRSSMLHTGAVAVTLCSLPLLFWIFPALASATLFGVSVPWLLLGVLPFPLVLLIGFLGKRRAEKHERDFLEMVNK